jgi:hypothetical protein
MASAEESDDSKAVDRERESVVRVLSFEDVRFVAFCWGDSAGWRVLGLAAAADGLLLHSTLS